MSGTFQMWGGEISGNSARSAGNDGQFCKRGGTAQWNQNSAGTLVDLAATNNAISLPAWPLVP
jgi:hypothetical protein